MLHRRSTALLLFASLACISNLASAQPAAFTPNKLDVAALTVSLDDVVKASLKQNHLPGAAVVVVQDGETIFKRGYGLADVEQGRIVDPDQTLFRIGSISKALTLLTLTRLIDSKRIAIDDDVERYFKGIRNPQHADHPVRTRHLLTHTSGFDQIGVRRHIYRNDLPLAERKAMRSGITDYLTENNLRVVSRPGLHYRYDTYGTTLAGAIIESITGKPYAEAMADEMFAPLGMTRSFVEVDEEHQESLAIGYGWNGNRFVSQPYEVYQTTPASSIDATPADMGRLLEALTSDGANQHGRLFSSAKASAVLSPQFRPHPEFLGVTHGLHESLDASGQFQHPIRSVDHGGSMLGYRAQLTVIPDHKIGVFLVTNRSSDAGGDRVQLAGTVMKAIVGCMGIVPTREPHAIPPRNEQLDLAEYVGSYRYGVFCHTCTAAEFARGAWRPGQPDAVTADRGTLTIRDREFFPRGQDVFVREDGKQMVYFGRNSSGAVAFFTFSTSADTFERVGQ